MKRMNYLINGFAALAFLFLFSQCAGKADNAAAPAASGNANATSGLKIAYVEVDTLLSQKYRSIPLLYPYPSGVIPSGTDNSSFL